MEKYARNRKKRDLARPATWLLEILGEDTNVFQGGSCSVESYPFCCLQSWIPRMRRLTWWAQRGQPYRMHPLPLNMRLCIFTTHPQCKSWNQDTWWFHLNQAHFVHARWWPVLEYKSAERGQDFDTTGCADCIQTRQINTMNKWLCACTGSCFYICFLRQIICCKQI